MIESSAAANLQLDLSPPKRVRRPLAGRSAGGASKCRLEGPGWNGKTRIALESLISQGAGRGLPVVFDFDNTIVCGDIGEATLAMLARSGVLTPANARPEICPPFRLPDRKWVRIRACADVTEYYEAMLAPTAHLDRDPTPLANGYSWAVEVMAGLRPWDIVEATRAAYEGPRRIEVTPGKTSYPAPFFYAEMIELLAELIRLRFEVWVVSASNVWSVRWMVLEALNPLLRERGVKTGLRGDHVIGISCLLSDAKGGLYKDSLLARENEGYASLEKKVLARFRLTSRLHFPAPTYSGKVAAIFDALGRNPYLAAGDSPGDHPMLTVSENRLWIARVEKPGYLQATRELTRKTGAAGWLYQAVRTKGPSGFLSQAVAG